MRVHKHAVGKIYPKYQPYPLTFGSEDSSYTSEPPEASGSPADNHRISESSDDLPDLTDDRRTPDWFYPESPSSNDAACLHPLRHLQSLFSDRLDFLQRTLDDLESAKKERQQIGESALEDIDSDISRCEKSMATLKAAFNNTEQQQLLERRLLELKRDRRRETGVKMPSSGMYEYDQFQTRAERVCEECHGQPARGISVASASCR
jgi:hypothetical protein